MLKIRKLNTDGFGHHLLIPVLVVALIAAAGSYVVMKSKADSIYRNGVIYIGNQFFSTDGSTKSSRANNYPYTLAFSPDGTQIAYMGFPSGAHVSGEDGKFHGNIYTAKSDGTDQKLIAENIVVPATYLEGRIVWSPDGNWLAYLTDIGGRGEYKQAAAVTKIDGSETNIVDLARASDETGDYDTTVNSISFYPDSKRLFSSRTLYKAQDRQHKPLPQLCTSDIAAGESVCTAYERMIPTDVPAVNGTTITRVSGIVYDVRLSPDGERIIFGYRVSVTGNCQQPDPDGYEDCDNSTYDNLYSATVSGTGVRNITQFSPLLPTQATKYTVVNDFNWSPDGSRIVAVYAKYNSDTSYTINAADSGLYVISKDGSQKKKVADNYYGQVSWQPILKGAEEPPLPPDSNRGVVSCEILPPANPLEGGKPVSLQAKFTNSGVQGLKLNAVVRYYTFAAGSGNTTITTPVIPSGQSVTIQLPPQTLPFATTDEAYFESSVDQEYLPDQPNSLDQRCAIHLALPKPTLSLNGPTSRTVTFSKPLVTSGLASPGIQVLLIHGTDEFGAINTARDGTFRGENYISPIGGGFVYFAQAANTSIRTGEVTVKFAPYIAGKTTQKVLKNKTVVVSGKYLPNTKLTVYMRKPSDPAGKYPQTISVKTNSSGYYSFSFKANTKKVYYIQAPNGTRSTIRTVNLK
jgi:hypothetical protein